MKLTIIGLGLIGASIAYALKSNLATRPYSITGYDLHPETLMLASKLKIIDHIAATIPDAVADAEMLLLAVPIDENAKIFAALSEMGKHFDVITDVGSVKTSVILAAKKYLLAEQFASFVPGHPIAGSEKSGIRAANAQLFKMRRVILTPQSETSLAAIQTVTEFWEKIGAQVNILSAEQHDQLLAATSHLPQILAYTLMNSLSRENPINQYQLTTGPGFRDVARIATSDPTLWRNICIANRTSIIKYLHAFEQSLAEIKNALENEDSESLQKLFSQAKQAKDSLS